MPSTRREGPVPMTASSAEREIERLMSLHPKGFDLSLDRIRRLLARLGNPQERLPPVIHIAGTNGKGSAAAFSRALLEAAGLRVHVHTSPHLVHWHERYRIGAPGGGLAWAAATLLALRSIPTNSASVPRVWAQRAIARSMSPSPNPTSSRRKRLRPRRARSRKARVGR